MYKVTLFVQKRPDLALSQFKDHCENHHVPLLNKILFGTPACRAPLVYKRSYIEKEKEIYTTVLGMPAPPPVDFDVITEMVFQDQDHYNEMMVAFSNPGVLAQIKEDESRFVKPDGIRAYIVDEASQ